MMDDDTLIAEHEKYEAKRRAQKSSLVFVVTLLTAIWVVFLAVVYGAVSGTFPQRGAAVFFGSVMVAISVIVVGIYWDSTL